MTISVTGRCGRTGRFGVAISSSSPAVASRCAHARAGVGAACSQNVTDPRLGSRLLDAMAAGASAEAAVTEVVRSEAAIDWRQLCAIGRAGAPAAYSGGRTLGRYATATGTDVVAGGNLLAGEDVVGAAVAAFEAQADGSLATRLLDALAAAGAAGGEEGPLHSAGILVVADVPWPVTDLRVDWSDDPLGELRSLWRRWEPEEPVYRLRALDPSASPGYGVPGDLRPPAR